MTTIYAESIRQQLDLDDPEQAELARVLTVPNHDEYPHSNLVEALLDVERYGYGEQRHEEKIPTTNVKLLQENDEVFTEFRTNMKRYGDLLQWMEVPFEHDLVQVVIEVDQHELVYDTETTKNAWKTFTRSLMMNSLFGAIKIDFRFKYCGDLTSALPASVCQYYWRFIEPAHADKLVDIFTKNVYRKPFLIWRELTFTRSETNPCGVIIDNAAGADNIVVVSNKKVESVQNVGSKIDQLRFVKYRTEIKLDAADRDQVVLVMAEPDLGQIKIGYMQPYELVMGITPFDEFKPLFFRDVPN